MSMLAFKNGVLKIVNKQLREIREEETCYLWDLWERHIFTERKERHKDLLSWNLNGSKGQNQSLSLEKE